MSSPNDINKPNISASPPEQSNMDNAFKNDDWKSVTDERLKGKKGHQNPSPGTMPLDKSAKKPASKRSPVGLHSASSQISAVLEKKKVKTVKKPAVQTELTGFFHLGQTSKTKATPGTAVVSKKDTPMSLKPRSTSPPMTTPPAPTESKIYTQTNYDDNISKKLNKINKINKKTNQSPPNSPIRAPPTKTTATTTLAATTLVSCQLPTTGTKEIAKTAPKQPNTPNVATDKGTVPLPTALDTATNPANASTNTIVHTNKNSTVAGPLSSQVKDIVYDVKKQTIEAISRPSTQDPTKGTLPAPLVGVASKSKDIAYNGAADKDTAPLSTSPETQASTVKASTTIINQNTNPTPSHVAGEVNVSKEIVSNVAADKGTAPPPTAPEKAASTANTSTATAHNTNPTGASIGPLQVKDIVYDIKQQTIAVRVVASGNTISLPTATATPLPTGIPMISPMTTEPPTSEATDRFLIQGRPTNAIPPVPMASEASARKDIASNTAPAPLVDSSPPNVPTPSPPPMTAPQPHLVTTPSSFEVLGSAQHVSQSVGRSLKFSPQKGDTEVDWRVQKLQAKGNQRPNTATPAVKKGNRIVDRAIKEARERGIDPKAGRSSSNTSLNMDTDTGSLHKQGDNVSAMAATIPTSLATRGHEPDTVLLPTHAGDILQHGGDSDTAIAMATLRDPSTTADVRAHLDANDRVRGLEKYDAAFLAMESSMAEQLDQRWQFTNDPSLTGINDDDNTADIPDTDIPPSNLVRERVAAIERMDQPRIETLQPDTPMDSQPDPPGQVEDTSEHGSAGSTTNPQNFTETSHSGFNNIDPSVAGTDATMLIDDGSRFNPPNYEDENAIPPTKEDNQDEEKEEDAMDSDNDKADDGSRFNPPNYEDANEFPPTKEDDPDEEQAEDDMDADDDEDDEASDATEQKANVTDDPQDDHQDDASSESDADEDEDEWETQCPDPKRPFFHRYDIVVNIPKNTNPSGTVATVIGKAMREVAIADPELIFYPYRASYYLKPIGATAELLALGSDVSKYVDKGKFDRFSARPVKNCRLSIALGSSLEPPVLCEAVRDPLFALDIQLYPKLLNYPVVVRAGFLLYSHKLHHSDKFQSELQSAISCPIASKWRRAAATIDLHQADTLPVNGKPAFLPSAICIECKESDLALVRAQLQHIYPLHPREDRFEYPRQTKASFCNTYNWYELDQVDDLSKEMAKTLWHIQLLTNQRERFASIALLLKKPHDYEYVVLLGQNSFTSVRRLLLKMKLPYPDSRGEFPSVFTSCDHNITFGTNDWDVGVTFRPQHAKYAQNVIENLALHLQNRSGCSTAYLRKVLRSSHRIMMKGKRWHVAHQKAFDPKHMQEGLTTKDLTHALAEFNLDITVVLQDAAMAVSRAAAATDGDGVSAPRAASNASQQLSMMNSVTTFREQAADIEGTRTKDQITPSQPDAKQTARNSWASVRQTTTTTIASATQPPAATTVTLASGESTTLTPTIQGDSSLTTTTEHRGLSEADVTAMLDLRDQMWQTRMAEEIARKLAEQREAYEKHQADKTSRRKSKVQTAQENGGGPST
jgi:hypothetical protein